MWGPSWRPDTYHHTAIKLANSFDGFYISHMSRLLNTKADALVVLAITLVLPAYTIYHLTVATHHPFYPKYGLEVSEVHTTSTNFEQRDWRFPIIDYAFHGILPDDPKEAASVRWRSTRFYYDVVVKTLYHCSYDSIFLRCLSSSKAQKYLKGPRWHIWSSPIRSEAQGATALTRLLLANYDHQHGWICKKV